MTTTAFRRLRTSPRVAWSSTSYIVQGLSIITGLALARGLLPEDRGELAGAVAWLGLVAMVATLGISEATSVFIARGNNPVRVLGQASMMLLATGLVACIAVTYGLPYVLPAGTMRLVTLGLPYLLFTLLTGAVTAALAGMRAFWRLAIVRISFPILLIAAIVVPYLLDALTATFVVTAYTLAELVVLLASLLLARPLLRARTSVNRRASRRQGAPEWRQLGAFGLRAHLSSVSTTLNERGDQLLMAVLLAPEDLARYAVAVSFAAPVATLGMSLAGVTLIDASTLNRGNAWSHATGELKRVAVWATGVAAMVILASWPMADILVGVNYPRLLPLIAVLAIAAIPLCCARVLSSLIKGLGRPGLAGIAEAVALSISAAALLLLMPIFGIFGAAYASLLGYSVSLVFLLVVIRFSNFDEQE